MKVAVVGGGFAGLSAAIHLQEKRHQVVLFERRGLLGGRAASYPDAATGEEIGNGVHLLVGAYRATRELLRKAGGLDLLLVQRDLRLDYVDDRGESALRCPHVTAPLHLLLGLARFRVPWRVRWDAVRLALAVRFGAPPQGLTLADYFRKTGQGAATRRLFWDGLSTAILNETPERAAAILFYNVYREAFLGESSACALVFPRTGLGAIHRRLAAYLEERGGVIRRLTQVERVDVEEGRVTGVRCARRDRPRDEVVSGGPLARDVLPIDAVVVATPWDTVVRLLPPEWAGQAPFARLNQLGASPIVSCDLWLDRIVVDRQMVGLRDCEMEWVFDVGRLNDRPGPPQHLSFIASAAIRTTARANAQIVEAAVAALRRYFPAMREASVVRHLVMREPAATFSCDPSAEALRPGPVTPIRGLYLAGDWTDTGLPATIEGAVRSGQRAAETLDRLS